MANMRFYYPESSHFFSLLVCIETQAYIISSFVFHCLPVSLNKPERKSISII